MASSSQEVISLFHLPQFSNKGLHLIEVHLPPNTPHQNFLNSSIKGENGETMRVWFNSLVMGGFHTRTYTKTATIYRIYGVTHSYNLRPKADALKARLQIIFKTLKVSVNIQILGQVNSEFDYKELEQCSDKGNLTTFGDFHKERPISPRTYYEVSLDEVKVGGKDKEIIDNLCSGMYYLVDVSELNEKAQKARTPIKESRFFGTLKSAIVETISTGISDDEKKQTYDCFAQQNALFELDK